MTAPTADPNAHTIRLLGMEADEFDALATEHEVAMLQERVAELEFMTEDAGWERIDDSGTDLDLAPEHLRRIIRDAQTMYLANPLINHAVDVIAVYVFGQGVNITGRGVANDRVQAFLMDRGNQRTLTGQGALIAADRALTYEGNRFYALFGKPGEVTRVRNIPTFHIVAGDIVTNPDDDAEVWYYLRRWTRKVGGKREARVDYYPDLYYQPKTKPARWGDGMDAGEVHWDSPVIHVKDGGLTGGKFGVPTIFSSLNWARAVSRDLSDYATVKRALARFAWKVTAKTRAGARSARERLQSTVTTGAPVESNPPPQTGSAFVAVEGNDLTPLKTAGAAPNPEEGRRLGLMVAAGAGVPETILFGNADAGNLATAKTLDRPTELMMSARQSIWADTLTEIVAYDLRRAREESVLPQMEPDPDAPEDAEPLWDTGTQTVIADPAAMRPVDLTPDVSFVDILEDDVTARVAAIVMAATLGANGKRADTMPDVLLSRLLLEALGVEDIDEVLEKMEEEAEAEPEAVPPSEVEPEPVMPLLPAVPEQQFAEALDAFTASLSGRPRRKVRLLPPQPTGAMTSEGPGEAVYDVESYSEAPQAPAQGPLTVNVNVPPTEVPVPIVNVDVPAPIVNVEAPVVNVEAAPAPVVNVAPPVVNVEAPVIHMPAAEAVAPPAPIVNVDVQVPDTLRITAMPKRTTRRKVTKRDQRGAIAETVDTEEDA